VLSGVAMGVNQQSFSSTAAVYGEPKGEYRQTAGNTAHKSMALKTHE